MVFASMPVCLGHALGRPARRRTREEVRTPLAARISKDRVDDGRLADAWTAGDDSHLRSKGKRRLRVRWLGARIYSVASRPRGTPIGVIYRTRAGDRRASVLSRSAMSFSAWYSPPRKRQVVPSPILAMTALQQVPVRVRVSMRVGLRHLEQLERGAFSSSTGNPQWPSSIASSAQRRCRRECAHRRSSQCRASRRSCRRSGNRCHGCRGRAGKGSPHHL